MAIHILVLLIAHGRNDFAFFLYVKYVALLTTSFALNFPNYMLVFYISILILFGTY